MEFVNASSSKAAYTLTWQIVDWATRNLCEVFSKSEGLEDLPRPRPEHDPCADLAELTCRLVQVDTDVSVSGERDRQTQSADATATVRTMSARSHGGNVNDVHTRSQSEVLEQPFKL